MDIAIAQDPYGYLRGLVKNLADSLSCLVYRIQLTQ
jgi:hypothetical protein